MPLVAAAASTRQNTEAVVTREVFIFIPYC
jgi:hypothetical protein